MRAYEGGLAEIVFQLPLATTQPESTRSHTHKQQTNKTQNLLRLNADTALEKKGAAEVTPPATKNVSDRPLQNTNDGDSP